MVGEAVVGCCVLYMCCVRVEQCCVSVCRASVVSVPSYAVCVNPSLSRQSLADLNTCQNGLMKCMKVHIELADFRSLGAVSDEV